MTTETIAILGAGNMGGSLLSGLIANKYPKDNLWIADPEQEKLNHFKNEYKINITTDNTIAINAADVVVFAIKPQIFSQVAKSLVNSVQQKKPLIISVAAGITENHIQQWLGGKLAIVRSMPNTPALIRAGATALYANEFVTQEQHNLAESILRAVGVINWIKEEKLMDVITALSGSGPAYFFLIIEALQNAAIELGLSAETAQLLAQQTAYGSARMALESDLDMVELRRRVTSPGGTTEQAIKVLEENNLREIFKKAIMAATKRSQELAQEAT